MKKFLAAFLCAAVALSLSACNDNTETPNDDKDKSSVSDSKKDNDKDNDSVENSASGGENSEENSGNSEGNSGDSSNSAPESKPEESSKPEERIPDPSEYAEPAAQDFNYYLGGNSANPFVTVYGYDMGEEGTTAIKLPSEIEGAPVKTISDFEGTIFEYVILPDTITQISSGAFANSALKSINIPDSVLSIGSGNTAFEGTPYLENKLAGGAYFIDNNRLFFVTADAGSNIVIPNGVTKICISAFMNSVIETVTIPNSVETIAAQAFQGCANLKSIEIPDSVTTIGNKAFLDCENIQVTYKGKTYSYAEIDDLYAAING